MGRPPEVAGARACMKRVVRSPAHPGRAARAIAAGDDVPGGCSRSKRRVISRYGARRNFDAPARGALRRSD